MISQHPKSTALHDPANPGRMAEFDNIFQIPVGIDVAHHELHEGDMYSVHTFANVANAANFDLVIHTMDSVAKRIHMFFEAEVEAESEFYVYEDATYTDGTGVAVVPINRERNSAKTSDIQDMESNPNILGVGNLLVQTMAGSGKKVGGRARGLEELVLRNDTIYLFRITNVSGGIEWVSPQLTWYEHSNE